MHLICPHCRNPIEVVGAAAPTDVLCPSCGSSFHPAPGSTTDWSQANETRTLGRFELLQEVGAGAFGTVYMARDPQLDRLVALKVPRAGNLPGGADLDRFLREARSAAQLRHPAIVPVHEVGQADGVPYLVSDFVRGLTLADLLSGRRPSFAESARLAATLAEALDYAHQQGVIHRDVKPSNVMLDAEGRPHLTDFGLAKREAGEITVTLEGQVLGTPAYMSPEQAAGESHRVDGRSDVYSLGVVLFQMLTGELPFRGTHRMLLHQVLHDEPRPPRSLNENVPRDLETVCLKAMAKEPARRYRTAGELADDLHRFLRGEPVLARPPGKLERMVRWARRRPAAAALLVTSLAATAGLAAALTAWQANGRLEDLNGQLAGAVQEAQGQRQRAVAEEERARRYQYAADITLAGQLLHDIRHTAEMQRVLELLDRHRAAQGKTDLRSFEWYYLWRLCHAERFTRYGAAWDPGPEIKIDSYLRVAFTPDGKSLVTGSMKGSIQVLDALSGRQRVAFEVGNGDIYYLMRPEWLELLPDSRTALIVGDQRRVVKLWDLATGTERALVWRGDKTSTLVRTALSADGKRVALAFEDGKVSVRDLVSGKELAILEEQKPGVSALAFAPEGNRILATAARSGKVALWDVDAGKLLNSRQGHDGRITLLAFAPAGDVLATMGDKGVIKLWNLDKARQDIVGLCATLNAATNELSRLAFAPDGTCLAAAGGTRELKGSADVYLWNVATGAELARLHGHEGAVVALAFTPDSKGLATAGLRDGVVRIWDVPGGRERARLIGHTVPVLDLAFRKGGEVLATAAGTFYFGDNSLRRPELKVWGQESWDGRDAFSGSAFSGSGYWALSPDGRALALANGKAADLVFQTPTATELWDPGNGVKRASFPGDSCVAFSADGQTVATLTKCKSANAADFFNPGPPTLTLWDAPTGRARIELPGGVPPAHDVGAGSVLFAPDGRTLVTCASEITRMNFARPPDDPQAAAVSLRDPRTGAVRARLPGAWGPVQFSADSKTLVSFGGEGLKVWDVDTGTERCRLRVAGDEFWRFQFVLSPNARTVAVIVRSPKGDDATVRLLDAVTGQTTATLNGDVKEIRCLVFSADGQRLASGHGENSTLGAAVGWIKLWDAVTGAEQGTLWGHRSRVSALLFTPDGKRLIGASKTEVKVWDPVILQEVLTLPGGYDLQMSRDGRTLATGAGQNTTSQVRVLRAASDAEVLARDQ